MAIAVELNYAGGTLQQHDDAIKLLGLKPGDRHPGALFHWAAGTDDGFRVVDVWESKEKFDRFVQEQIAPIAEQAGMPEPDVRIIDVHSYMPGR